MTIWDNFASYAVNVLKLKVGDYIFLDNLLGKSNQNVDSSTGEMSIVAILHGDPNSSTANQRHLRLITGTPSTNIAIKQVEDNARRLKELRRVADSVPDDIVIPISAAASAEEVAIAEAEVADVSTSMYQLPNAEPFATTRILKDDDDVVNRSFFIYFL